MQVDTAGLRAAARTLRQETAELLRQAGLQLRQPEKAFELDAAFDTYTTAAPYREFAGAWTGELETLTEAARQLADSLDATAADYDAADARAGARLGTSR
jgi:hypothetical protein